MKLLDATCASKMVAPPHVVPGRADVVRIDNGGVPARSHTVVRRKIGEYVWHIRDDYVGVLDEIPPTAWHDLAHNHGAALVKENDGREVWRVKSAAGDVFAKIYVADDMAARLKRWIRGPACLAEWRVASYAQEHGLPAVQPIACAYRRSPWGGAECVLLTAGIPNAVPLNEYWTSLTAVTDPARRHRLVNRITTAVADLIATAHQSGFRHVDLHAGNLLVVSDPAEVEPPQVVFVDLHGVCIGRSVSDAATIRNLAQLNQWFRRQASIAQRIRFLHRYVRTRAALNGRSAHARPLGLDFGQLVAALDRRAHEHARELYAQRDRRAMRTNKYFARIRIPGGWRGHVFLCAKHPVSDSRASTTVFDRGEWRAWLRDPLKWIRPEQAWQMIKDSHSGTVCRQELPVKPEPLPVICKRSLARSLRRRISLMFRESRNLRTWRRGYALINRDMPTARPLAVLERRRFGLLLDSIVITEALPDAHDVDAVIATDLTHLPPRQQRRAKDLLIERLCDLVERMDARGFAHRDFKASNIMIQWDAEYATPPRLSLVDLDGLSVNRRVPRPPTVDAYGAIARLNASLDHCRIVTRTDRLRFLKLYLSGWGRDGGAWKPLWRELDARTGEKRRQYERHQAWKLRNYGRT